MRGSGKWFTHQFGTMHVYAHKVHPYIYVDSISSRVQGRKTWGHLHKAGASPSPKDVWNIVVLIAAQILRAAINNASVFAIHPEGLDS